MACSPLMGALRIARHGPGRPRTRPDRLLAGLAHSSAGIRAELRRRGIRATIPLPADQGWAPGSPRFRRRPTIRLRPRQVQGPEHRRAGFNKLKGYRAFVMRTDERAYIYAGTTSVAAIRIRLRDLTHHDPPDTPQQSGSGGGSPVARRATPGDALDRITATGREEPGPTPGRPRPSLVPGSRRVPSGEHARCEHGADRTLHDEQFRAEDARGD